MRTFLYFILLLAVCITAVYTYSSWLPPVVDFVFQKSTPATGVPNTDANNPDYQLYEKYKSDGNYSEPFEQCYMQCAKNDFSAFEFCSTANKCASLQ